MSFHNQWLFTITDLIDCNILQWTELHLKKTIIEAPKIPQAKGDLLRGHGPQA